MFWVKLKPLGSRFASTARGFVFGTRNFTSERSWPTKLPFSGHIETKSSSFCESGMGVGVREGLASGERAVTAMLATAMNGAHTLRLMQSAK
ncbi:MAG TPA: hypothetical protein VN861_02260 [Candidatus Acidoferrales bacterium]|nr:hypothetical protein [Candidatus Acidoferrales bacterium]